MERKMRNLLGIFYTLFFNHRTLNKKELLRLVTYGPYISKPFTRSNIATLSLYSYREKVVKQSIRELKFHNHIASGACLGEILYSVLTEHLSDYQMLYNFSLPVLLAVPVSPVTLRRRGYNHNHVVCQSFINAGGSEFCSYEPKALLKNVHVKAQSHCRSRAERLAKPYGVFSVHKNSNLEKRNIILFDDVITTGATSGEVIRILKKIGVNKILLVSLAR